MSEKMIQFHRRILSKIYFPFLFRKYFVNFIGKIKICNGSRYMDDWVILVKTRTQLRRLIKKMHQVMQGLQFELALDKTTIGKVQNGFDFLGVRFNHRGIIGLAKQSILNFISRIAALYEQGASDQRIGQYVRRWCVWAKY